METPEQARRANFARQILDNPLYGEAMHALDESLRHQRIKVRPTDTDGHTKLIMMEQVRHQFEAYLRRAIEEGKLTQPQMVNPTLVERVFAR